MNMQQSIDGKLKSEGVGTSHIAAKEIPPVPWEIGENISYRVLKADPVHGVFSVQLLAPADTGLGVHRHTGYVQVFTAQGSWKYNEHDWVAEPESLVYETADSVHSFVTLPGDDLIAYATLNGTLEFMDDDNNVVHVENWRTMVERQNKHLESLGLPVVDVTSFQEN